MKGFIRAHAEAYAGMKLIRELRKIVDRDVSEEITFIKDRIVDLGIDVQLRFTTPVLIGKPITEDQVLWAK
jgi:hypothetical protein